MKFNSIGKDLVLVVLALFSLFLLLFEFRFGITADNRYLIQNIDLFIALVFLIDFIVRFSLSNQKINFLKNNWWQLLAAIPVTTSATQFLRGLMILRLVQLARVTSISIRLGILFKSWRYFFEQTKLLTMAVVVFLFTLIGSVIFYLFESPVNSKVVNFYDSLWYISGVITTTGVGDISPVTLIGRLISIALMFTGSILIGVLAALLVSYLIKR